MKTIEIISLIWVMIVMLFGLVAKWNQINVFITMIGKLLCVISLLYFGSVIIKLIP